MVLDTCLTVLTPQLQNVNNRKTVIGMMAELEINSGWTVIKLAYYLYPICSYDSMLANQ